MKQEPGLEWVCTLQLGIYCLLSKMECQGENDSTMGKEGTYLSRTQPPMVLFPAPHMVLSTPPGIISKCDQE